MSSPRPQLVGIGGVAGTVLGTVLMAYGGLGECAVYVCAASGACILPVMLADTRSRAARARKSRRAARRAKAGVRLLGSSRPA